MTKKKLEAENIWAKTQIENFEKIRSRFDEYAVILEKVLSKAAKKYAPLAIIQTRPKAISSFAEKIQRKRELYVDAVKDMTDLCGGRVITHTQTQVDAMCRFIEDNFEIDWENSENVSQRLDPSEFGYLSVHYIVQFNPDIFPNNDIDIMIPESVIGLKAEIQVRTLLQHAWADISHDLSYKNEIKLPGKWHREFAVLAAVLENADKSFCRIEDGLKTYEASYGAYLSETQMREEIEKLEFVLNYDRSNSKLAGKIGKMAIILGDWNKAVTVLSEALKSKSEETGLNFKELVKTNIRYQPLLRDLGVALCKENKDFKKGQEYIEAASDGSFKDADALASLAGSYKGKDEDKVREYYRKAYEIAPSDPYPLLNYLECEIIHQKNLSLVKMLNPVIKRAIQTCYNHIEVGMNLPWAYFNLGKLYLLLNKPYESMSAHTLAIQFSTAEFMIETSLKSLERLAVIEKELPGYEWIRQTLLIGLLTKFPDKINKNTQTEYLHQLENLSTIKREKAAKIKTPVIMVAGSCDPKMENNMNDYRELLLESFKDYEGTIFSGGTISGISGLVGEIQEKRGNKVHTIGYQPVEGLPDDATEDRRYSEIRKSIDADGKKEFSPMQPIQVWIDIIVSGISPSNVKVLGINGGNISSIEYKLALALGASVALIEGSGREAGKLLQENEWNGLKQLIRLPKDAKKITNYIIG